jgi:photosystem II stability/assembly factor-like uncharacterized protein
MVAFAYVTRLLLCACCLCGFVEAADPSWHRIEIGTTDDSPLDSITFVDDQVGWLVAGQRSVFKTVDGGNSWKPVGAGLAKMNVNLGRLWFSDRNTGWAAAMLTNAPALLKSSDGGLSWSVEHVWPQADAGLPGAMTDVRFADAMNGWAVGFNGPKALIVHTNDGGSHWTMQYSGSEIAGAFHSIAVADAGNVWVSSRLAAMSTYDGGDSWNLRFFGSGLLGDLSVLDAQDIWMADGWGLLLHTTNGNSWKEVRFEDLADTFIGWVTFLDRKAGWASGTEGQILVTQDGGQSWRRDDIPKALLGPDPSTGKMVVTSSGIFVIANPGAIITKSIR